MTKRSSALSRAHQFHKIFFFSFSCPFSQKTHTHKKEHSARGYRKIQKKKCTNLLKVLLIFFLLSSSSCCCCWPVMSVFVVRVIISFVFLVLFCTICFPFDFVSCVVCMYLTIKQWQWEIMWYYNYQTMTLADYMPTRKRKTCNNNKLYCIN